MSTRTMKRDHGFMILIHNRHHGVDTLNCKILLPKFNTWKQGQIEREKGFEVPLFSTASAFSGEKSCRYGAIASRLQCNGNAITP